MRLMAVMTVSTHAVDVALNVLKRRENQLSVPFNYDKDGQQLVVAVHILWGYGGEEKLLSMFCLL